MQGQGPKTPKVKPRINDECRNCRTLQLTITFALVLAFAALVAFLMYYIPER